MSGISTARKAVFETLFNVEGKSRLAKQLDSFITWLIVANLLALLDDGDAAVRLVEFDGAVLQSEERPVTTDTDILAGVGLAAALTDNDVTADDALATELLYAKATAC